MNISTIKGRTLNISYHLHESKIKILTNLWRVRLIMMYTYIMHTCTRWNIFAPMEKKYIIKYLPVIFTIMLYHIYLCVFFDTLQSVMDVSHMNMLWLKNDWVNFVILNVCFTCFCHKQPFPSVLQDLGLSASLYHHLTAHLLNDQEIFYNYSIYIQIHFPLVFIFF